MIYAFNGAEFSIQISCTKLLFTEKRVFGALRESKELCASEMEPPSTKNEYWGSRFKWEQKKNPGKHSRTGIRKIVVTH